ncbi:NAD(P)H:quinone oxidoreductase [Bacillus shivajii]|uniref:NAD(P)H:quinone oxidoreductase n=1 Tax=Bacillus shivajii TaxID=1983719 RepID=UPI001CFA0F42|nr:NAD(P)H:quinone oxidoreductase [Bacillus shivajii]UCZ53533.1 NAD(P)H:quinone oxidoreductase [Bacillus shivajii]
MSNINLAVIYYSSTGTNYKMAKWAEEGGKAAGANVKLVKVPELAPQEAIESNPAWKAHLEETKDVPEATLDDLEWADAIIFSVPTRFGNVPAQMKQFLDTTGGLWFNGKLANKAVSAMSSASNAHGGQEATILALYQTMHHWGSIIASPGYTDPVQFEVGGNPYGVSVTVDQDGNMVEDVKKGVLYQAKRTVQVGEWIKKGNQ